MCDRLLRWCNSSLAHRCCHSVQIHPEAQRKGGGGGGGGGREERIWEKKKKAKARKPVDSQKPIRSLTGARSEVLLTPTKKKKDDKSDSCFTPQRMTLLIVSSLFPPSRMTDYISQPRLSVFVFQQSLGAGRGSGFDTHAWVTPLQHYNVHDHINVIRGRPNQLIMEGCLHSPKLIKHITSSPYMHTAYRKSSMWLKQKKKRITSQQRLCHVLYNLFQQLLAPLCVMTVHLLHISTSIIPTCKVFVVSPSIQKQTQALCQEDKMAQLESFSQQSGSRRTETCRFINCTVHNTHNTCISMCIYAHIYTGQNMYF